VTGVTGSRKFLVEVISRICPAYGHVIIVASRVGKSASKMETLAVRSDTANNPVYDAVLPLQIVLVAIANPSAEVNHPVHELTLSPTHRSLYVTLLFTIRHPRARSRSVSRRHPYRWLVDPRRHQQLEPTYPNPKQGYLTSMDNVPKHARISVLVVVLTLSGNTSGSKASGCFPEDRSIQRGRWLTEVYGARYAYYEQISSSSHFSHSVLSCLSAVILKKKRKNRRVPATSSFVAPTLRISASKLETFAAHSNSNQHCQSPPL